MKNIEVPLQAVATVRTLLTYRDRAPNFSDDGNAFALTIKDIVANKIFYGSDLAKIEVDDYSPSSVLSEGNIVLPARGEYYPARYFSELEKPVFPIGQISVISIDLHSGYYLDPQYLVWFLNRPDSQIYIKNSITGTNIKSLSKNKLLNLPIQVPSENTQKSISYLQNLHEKRLALRQELFKIENLEIDNLCQILLLKNEQNGK